MGDQLAAVAAWLQAQRGGLRRRRQARARATRRWMDEPAMTVGELVDAISRSAADLKLHGRHPVRVRMHPLDAELLFAEHFPDAKRGRMWRFMGMDVAEDESARLGEPVAEFDPTLDRQGNEVGS